jgi:hypothetical protein
MKADFTDSLDLSSRAYDVLSLLRVAQELIAEIRAADEEGRQRLEQAHLVLTCAEERTERLNDQLEGLAARQVGHLDCFDSEHRT